MIMNKLGYMRYALTLSLAAFLLSATVVQADTRFFDDLPDMPVAAHITPLPDQNTIFDKPQGRFVQLVALLDEGANKEQVQTFYARSLPAFGWTRLSENLYQRGHERLELTFETRKNLTYLYITLEP